jgi:hypothetical protein
MESVISLIALIFKRTVIITLSWISVLEVLSSNLVA